jgi:hypothetical protein
LGTSVFRSLCPDLVRRITHVLFEHSPARRHPAFTHDGTAFDALLKCRTVQPKARVLQQVRTFDEFTPDNDPHQEHDFGVLQIDGEQYFFKLDYYDRRMAGGSKNPSDPVKTTRVLTVMLASEY